MHDALQAHRVVTSLSASAIQLLLRETALKESPSPFVFTRDPDSAVTYLAAMPSSPQEQVTAVRYELDSNPHGRSVVPTIPWPDAHTVHPAAEYFASRVAQAIFAVDPAARPVAETESAVAPEEREEGASSPVAETSGPASEDEAPEAEAPVAATDKPLTESDVAAASAVSEQAAAPSWLSGALLDRDDVSHDLHETPNERPEPPRMKLESWYDESENSFAPTEPLSAALHGASSWLRIPERDVRSDDAAPHSAEAPAPSQARAQELYVADAPANALHVGGLDDDLERTVFAPQRRATVSWTLRADDGTTYLLSRKTVIGRRPSAPLLAPTAIPVQIADPDKTLSKTHALLELGHDSVWVTDLGSTNGSEIAANPPIELEPSLRTEVAAGSRLRFGDVTLELVQTSL